MKSRCHFFENRSLHYFYLNQKVLKAMIENDDDYDGRRTCCHELSESVC